MNGWMRVSSCQPFNQRSFFQKMKTAFTKSPPTQTASISGNIPHRKPTLNHLSRAIFTLHTILQSHILWSNRWGNGLLLFNFFLWKQGQTHAVSHHVLVTAIPTPLLILAPLISSLCLWKKLLLTSHRQKNHQSFWKKKKPILRTLIPTWISIRVIWSVINVSTSSSSQARVHDRCFYRPIWTILLGMDTSDQRQIPIYQPSTRWMRGHGTHTLVQMQRMVFSVHIFHCLHEALSPLCYLSHAY